MAYCWVDDGVLLIYRLTRKTYLTFGQEIATQENIGGENISFKRHKNLRNDLHQKHTQKHRYGKHRYEKHKSEKHSLRKVLRSSLYSSFKKKTQDSLSAPTEAGMLVIKSLIHLSTKTLDDDSSSAVITKYANSSS